MPVFRLEKDVIIFPNPLWAEKNGLLAIGGDLRVERLLLAYSHGIFPWYSEGEPIQWWCPQERYIIRPQKIHVSHSMKKFQKKHEIDIRFNRDFADTIHRCRMKREFAEGTWITDDMEKAYSALHEAGYAMSVEAFVDGDLAGGLYGVRKDRCFFGESMFSDAPNGSKLALIGLADHLAAQDCLMIDCQFYTPHLESMGGERIGYREYMELIGQGR
ncbi:MAG: leucyl/phenylalanyl-tRNA--protein transferase [Lachnospiraceae bacterium]|jgi:leucyl/phenylalanyl-tRNA--protein transferase|nr:leucyl/phenylalanyl-tRNA--protein transferase [Lachnospiraceae bacterium]